MGVAIDALVLSCYELGHQPVAAASALAFLERAGHRGVGVDLAVEPLDRLEACAEGGGVRLVAVSAPMHTALRLAARSAARIRAAFPRAHLCFFGDYAWLNAAHLLEGVCDSVIGGEAGGPLVELAGALAGDLALDGVSGLRLAGRQTAPHLERLSFPVPARDSLPAVERYARLEVGGATRTAAAIEASRGCLHACRHCPIPAVYGGRFFVVPRDVLLADVEQLVTRGVSHLTFADADFFNGPGHTMAVARAIHERWPELTFDVTTKIENVLRRRGELAELADCGCLFLVTAVESLSDDVLRALRKGHTREDVLTATRLLREAGIFMRPSLMPFTPWETLRGYLDLLAWVERDGLVDQVDPVQYSIRLLVPPGSLLLGLGSLWPHLVRLRPERFAHEWKHPDPRMDRLAHEVADLAAGAARRDEPAARTFAAIRRAAHRAAGLGVPPDLPPPRATAPAPRLTESWFC